MQNVCSNAITQCNAQRIAIRIGVGGMHLVVILMSLLRLSGSVRDWYDCLKNKWVPFRRDGAGNASYSFFTCMQQMPPGTKPDWENSHRGCRALNTKPSLPPAQLAYWTHWKELEFYYNVFQEFKQTLSSSTYFMVFVNLREEPFPKYESYYFVYNTSLNQSLNQEWNYLRETMINVKRRKYVEPGERRRLGINCGAFRMEKNGFVNSDIDFVPCNENTYKESLVYDIQNDLSHFLCRKERPSCPAPETEPLGQNVQIIEGIYSYYYGTIRERSQIPNPGMLANITHCHKGCTKGPIRRQASPVQHGVTITYYHGDWLQYWCLPGYKANQDKHWWEPNYAYCTEEGAWSYQPCALSDLCLDAQCQNGGTSYSYQGNCMCDCVNGWMGDRCQELTPNYPCHSNPCLNGGTCMTHQSLAGGYYCVCAGAMGYNCEFELNECSSNPCESGSLCVDQKNAFKCVCDPLQQGIHCNEIVPYCTRFSEPCKNGADCYSCNIDTFKGWCAEENRTQYMCNCRMGYTGLDCSIKVEEKLDAWQIFSIVLGCMLFIIVSLFCEIIGSRRRHDHDNLQVLLESIDGYLKQQNRKPTLSNLAQTRQRAARISATAKRDGVATNQGLLAPPTAPLRDHFIQSESEEVTEDSAAQNNIIPLQTNTSTLQTHASLLHTRRSPGLRFRFRHRGPGSRTTAMRARSRGSIRRSHLPRGIYSNSPTSSISSPEAHSTPTDARSYISEMEAANQRTDYNTEYSRPLNRDNQALHDEL